MAIPSLTSPAMLAVQQKVNALMKQGMPAAQIGQVLQQEVLPTGSVPVSQLWQLMNYVKANSQKTQAPPSDTVALQLANQVQQIAHQKMNPMAAPQMGAPPTQQMPPPVGASGPSAGPPPGPPGVAGLPSNMGAPQAMAGGGIVAFDDGGSVFGDAATAASGLWGDVTNPFDQGVEFARKWPGKAMDFLGNEAKQGVHRLAEHYRQQGAPPPPDYAGQQAPLNPFDSGPGPNGGMQGLAGLATPGTGIGGGQFQAQAGPPQPPSPPPAAPLDTSPYAQQGGGYGVSMRGGIGGLPTSEKIDIPEEHDLDWHVSQAQAAAKKLGIGAAYQLADEYANTEQAKEAHDEKIDRGLALANAGFAMAQAASQGGATFLGSAAAGGLVWAKKIGDAREREDQANERIQMLKIKAAEAADSDKRGILHDSYEGMQNEVRERNAARREQAMIAVEHEKAITSLQAAAMHAEAYRTASGRNDPNLLAMQDRFGKNPTLNNPILDVIGKYTAASSGTASASMQRGDASMAAAQSMAISNFQRNNPVLMMALQNEKDPDKLKELKTRYDAGIKNVLAPFAGLGGGGNQQFDMTSDKFFGTP